MDDRNLYGKAYGLKERGFAKRILMVLFAIVLAAVSQSSLADLTDASWTVRRVGSDVEIENMNKASFRKYAFHRASGMLKCIGWNVRQPEKFYVLLTLSASLDEPAKRSDGSFAYSFNFSIPLYAPRWWQFWL